MVGRVISAPRDRGIEVHTSLRRRLGLPLLVLYGTGITIGAGIYVLIGAVAGHAKEFAPWSFLLASVVMAFTVASYTELTTRFPVSAGEAAYVRAAFQSRSLAILIGLLTIVVPVISSAAVVLGSAGYIQQFVHLPQAIIVVIVIAVLSAVAAWGILQSVILASLFTLIEVGGLLAIIATAIYVDLPIVSAIANRPPLDIGALAGIASGGLLAFFAFVGFEDLANVVEEAKEPSRDIPRAMILTLLISTVLYVVIAGVAVSALSIDRLSQSTAPLSLVFREIAGVSPATISAIAIVATLNTILAQMTMAARVVYGMAREHELPAVLARVGSHTGTPVIATALIAALIIPVAILVSFEGLAESTSVLTLAVFAFVNLALIRLQVGRIHSEFRHVSVPKWVPIVGLVSCIAMIASTLLG